MYEVHGSGGHVNSRHRLLSAAKKSAQTLANKRNKMVEVYDPRVGRVVAEVDPRAPKKRRKRSSGGLFGGLF